MVAVADELADVVDVIDDSRHGAAGGLRIGRRVVEVDLGIEHELGKDRADDAAALGDSLDHLVAEVALAGDEGRGSCSGWRGPGLASNPKAARRPNPRRGSGRGRCSLRRGRRAGDRHRRTTRLGCQCHGPRYWHQMRQSDRAQALLPPPAYLLGAEDGVGAFHAQNQADRSRLVGICQAAMAASSSVGSRMKRSWPSRSSAL